MSGKFHFNEYPRGSLTCKPTTGKVEYYKLKKIMHIYMLIMHTMICYSIAVMFWFKFQDT